MHLTELRVIDAFGQKIDLLAPNLNSITPISGEEMVLPQKKMSVADANFPKAQSFVLPPRLIQPARIKIDLLANDDSGNDTVTQSNPNPVCGWLIPNHLDGGIAVYDGNGILLGEILPTDLTTSQEAEFIHQISNKGLQRVVKTIAAHKEAGEFDAFLQTIDETLWLVDPLGGRKDQLDSVMLGRPLAVIQTKLQLELDGPAYTNQQLAATLATPDVQNAKVNPNGKFYARRDSGEVASVKFPVRLGRPEFRDDGLIGYFLNKEFVNGTQQFTRFYATHLPEEVSQSQYFKAIQHVEPIQKDHYVELSVTDGEFNVGHDTLVTMLVDPRGKVHATSGLLPVMELELPHHAIEASLKKLSIQFRVGPVLSPPGQLSIPLPADKQSEWEWTPERLKHVDGSKQHLFPHDPQVMHEGWLTRKHVDR